MKLRTRSNFDSDWRFRRGESASYASLLTYAKMRPLLRHSGAELSNPVAGKRLSCGVVEQVPLPVEFAESDFDDSGWRKLDLPHDWAAEEPFDLNLPGETGKLPWVGVGWYRKRFELTEQDVEGRVLEMEFDGAMSHALVWVNGKYAGGWVYGYTTFRVDMTPHLHEGQNMIAVRLDNPSESSRWYPGSGLYRHVWLLSTPKLRFSHWGTHVSTPIVSECAQGSLVHVALEVEQLEGSDLTCEVETEIYECGEGGELGSPPVAKSQLLPLSLRAEGLRSGSRSHTIWIPTPKLWSIESPSLYVARTHLYSGGKRIDTKDTTFGIRSLRFSAQEGFILNGRRIPLRGVCMHHDLGALGTAVCETAIRRQLRLLQEMGCNSIRTAHNPPAPELLEACDQMGILVVVEAFDCWRLGKCRNDYGQYFDDWYEKDLRAMVRRDRNHPCVVLWSIGNEVLEFRRGDGWKLAAHLSSIVKEEDPNRDTTLGCNVEEAAFLGFQNAVDVLGFNYKPWAYARLKSEYPHLPVYGSETSSCVSSRGEYFFPVSDDKSQGLEGFHVSSYDLSAPPWAWPPDREFEGLDEAPYAAGEFVWTGFDYLGEPTPFNADETNLLNFDSQSQAEQMHKQLEDLEKTPVPSRSSYFGIMDLAGFKKDRFFLYQSRWRPETPVAHILPHWNWPERIGEITPVHLYTNGDEAELFLNGVSCGIKRRGARDYRLRWNEIVYEPGELKVVVRRGGEPWTVATRRTSGEPCSIVGTVDSDRGGFAEGDDGLVFVVLRIVDERDDTVPTAKMTVMLEVGDGGQIVAVDNGDPTSLEPFRSKQVSAFNGLALAIVRVDPRCEVWLSAHADGLASARIALSPSGK